jgi:MurNAc alpha-1-phosphate uridylyltransferase
VAYQAQRIQTDLGDGQAFGIQIHYSIEPEESPLEMGGGIVQALPLLGDAPFLVLSSDVWTDYPLSRLFKPLNGLAHIILADNPWHHPQGDFCLDSQGLVQLPHHPAITRNFAGIGLYHPELFAGYPPGVQKIAPIFHAAMAKKQISGEYYSGRWINVTTSRCLQDAQILCQKQS